MKLIIIAILSYWLIRDSYRIVVRGKVGVEHINLEAMVFNAQTLDFAKFIVWAIYSVKLTTLQVFFAGAYLWLSEFSWVGYVLAGFQVIYIWEYSNWFVKFQLPAYLPRFFRVLVGIEFAIGMPLLVYRLFF